MLFGHVGIDLFAGPTEILVIADGSADPRIVASDLVGQAEHGPDSPAWMVALDRRLAEAVMAAMPDVIEGLQGTQRAAAAAARRDHGEVVPCESRAEAAEIGDRRSVEQTPETQSL